MTSAIPPLPGTELTGREREVLQAVADGLSDSEIARALVVSTGTVKSHLLRIRQRLGASNRAHAVYLGLKAGVIQ